MFEIEEVARDFLAPANFQTSFRVHPDYYRMDTSFLSRGQNGLRIESITQLRLLLRSRTCWVTSQISLYHFETCAKKTWLCFGL